MGILVVIIKVALCLCHPFPHTYEYTHPLARIPTHTRTHTYENTHSWPCIHAQKHTHTHPHIQTHTHTHTRTHTRSHMQTHSFIVHHVPCYSSTRLVELLLTFARPHYGVIFICAATCSSHRSPANPTNTVAAVSMAACLPGLQYCVDTVFRLGLHCLRQKCL